ncbi:hypothetical protein QA635_16245 [Bradyrhizobium brasilense]|uniref:hypothetical protein n=1 Tax=Bradyrhizobium TaxID=374 RepID=UPI001CD1F20C|nr:MULTISPECIES: hypothetical protein [Bradyrhizobium]MCA1396578.1 hypothetical protein [Bradyrhizobium sp. BRP56]WFU35870.1 hypothetical protein QA635_16245 [Bradyrhizobium australafricanum]
MDWEALWEALLGSFVPTPTGSSLLDAAPTGIFRSPLFWTWIALLAVMIGLAYTIIHIGIRSSPALLWLVLLVDAVAWVLVRRALKWRYPI